MAPEWEPTSDGINFAAVAVEVGKHLAPDAIVSTDAGNFSSFVRRNIGFRCVNSAFPGTGFFSLK